MGEKYLLKLDAFELFMSNPIHELKQEIAKAKAFIIKARMKPHRYPNQAREYDIQYNRWKALEFVELLKLGTITKEEFDTKVFVDKGIPND